MAAMSCSGLPSAPPGGLAVGAVKGATYHEEGETPVFLLVYTPIGAAIGGASGSRVARWRRSDGVSGEGGLRGHNSRPQLADEFSDEAVLLRAIVDQPQRLIDRSRLKLTSGPA